MKLPANAVFEGIFGGLGIAQQSSKGIVAVGFNGTASMFYLPPSSDIKRKITWPLWIAGGVSFRPVARLLLSADVQWTQWSKLDRITTEYLDAAWADLMIEVNGANVRVLAWKDATQLRFGAEYILNPSTVLRAGYYNDPAPSPDTTLSVLLPSHTFNAFSIGVGKTFSDLQLDFGLEYLMGNKRTGRADPALDPWLGVYRMHIIVPSISVSYKF
jgi:long-chain fatty acid transport protein